MRNTTVTTTTESRNIVTKAATILLKPTTSSNEISARHRVKRQCPASPCIPPRTSSKRRAYLEAPGDPNGSDNKSDMRVARANRSNNSSSIRHISFEMDGRRRIKSHTRRIENRSQLKNQKDLLWWNENELAEIMEREQHVFEVFSTCCASYVETVLRVWDVCSGTSASSRRSPSSRDALFLSANDVDKIATAPARGMEIDVVTSMFPDWRNDAVKSVINTQNSMARASRKVRVCAMKRRYRTFSKTSSLFARSIADGDAQVAVSLQ